MSAFSAEKNFTRQYLKILRTSRSQQIFDRVDTADALNFLIVNRQLLEYLMNKYDSKESFCVRIYDEKFSNPLEELRYSLCSHFVQKEGNFEERKLNLSDFKALKLNEIHLELPAIKVADIVKTLRDKYNQHWGLAKKGLHKEIDNYISNIDTELLTVVSIVSCFTAAFGNLFWKCALETKQTDFLWAHGTGHFNLMELDVAEFFCLRSSPKIDFSKGVLWLAAASFEKFSQEYNEAYIFSHLVSCSPDFFINLLYLRNDHKILLRINYEDQIYQSSVTLKNRKSWRVIGFSLFPSKAGLAFSLYVDEEMTEGSIDNFCTKFGSWDFKVGTYHDKSKGIRIALSDNACLWTNDTIKANKVIGNMNLIAQTLPDDFSTRLKKVSTH